MASLVSVSERCSTFRVSCIHCDSELIAPVWSEYRSKQQNRHLWRCWKCDCCFETIADTNSMEGSAASGEIPPLPLVA